MGKGECSHESKPAILLTRAKILCWSEVRIIHTKLRILQKCLIRAASLATMQMKIHMGMILRKFRIEGHPETSTYSMEPLDFFQGKPRGGKCLMYFKKDE